MEFEDKESDEPEEYSHPLTNMELKVQQPIRPVPESLCCKLDIPENSTPQ